MINVQIDETTLLNLFKDRLEYWTSNILTGILMTY